MRNQRGKQYDWSRCFKQISSKKQFDYIEANDNEYLIVTNGEDTKKSSNQDKKQQIIVPKYETVKRITQVKKFAGVPFYYIHITKDLTLPKLYYYELTEVDHIFVNAHEGKFKCGNKNALTTQFLQKAFVEMETKAGRDPTLPRNKLWMTNFIEREYKDLTKMANYDEFAQVVYNYWRNRREELKFPLLRALWRANADQYNHLLAFKIREKEKRNLRRVNRIADEQISVQLGDQFQNMLKICERIKMREELKLKMVKLNVVNFHSEFNAITQKSQISQFIEEAKRQNFSQTVSKDKQKIKSLQLDLQVFRKRRQTYEEEQQQEEIVSAVFDQKLTIVNFLSTVASFAQQFGINYEIFNPPQTMINTQKPVDKNPIHPKPILPLEDSDKHEGLNIQLFKHQDMVIRKLCVTDNCNTRRVPSNYLQYRKRNLCNYYFGDDDQGENKEIRKNISASFKKFLQMSKAHQ